MRNRNRARVSNLLTETNMLFPIFHRGEGVKSSFKLTGFQIVKKLQKIHSFSLSLLHTQNISSLFWYNKRVKWFISSMIDEHFCLLKKYVAKKTATAAINKIVKRSSLLVQLLNKCCRHWFESNLLCFCLNMSYC